MKPSESGERYQAHVLRRVSRNVALVARWLFVCGARAEIIVYKTGDIKLFEPKY